MEEPIVPYVQKVEQNKMEEPIVPYVQKVEQKPSVDEKLGNSFGVQLLNLMKTQQEMHKKNLMLELSNLIISIFIFIFLIIIVVLGTRGT